MLCVLCVLCVVVFWTKTITPHTTCQKTLYKSIVCCVFPTYQMKAKKPHWRSWQRARLLFSRAEMFPQNKQTNTDRSMVRAHYVALSFFVSSFFVSFLFYIVYIYDYIVMYPNISICLYNSIDQCTKVIVFCQ